MRSREESHPARPSSDITMHQLQGSLFAPCQALTESARAHSSYRQNNISGFSRAHRA